MRPIGTCIATTILLQCATASLFAVQAQGRSEPGARSHRAEDVWPATAHLRPQQSDGPRVYSTTCAACHQAKGEGLEGVFPPLVGSEWVADEEKLVRIILQGLSGPVDVAGKTYSGVMPGWGEALKDPEIAAVATYIRGAWGNKSAAVTTAKVAAIRAATAARTTPWTVQELARAAIPTKK